jgi:(p)ppGpp synthase/HD superfamily hydrolase
MNQIYKAIAFAAERHGEQKYGTVPYWHHLIQVNEVVSKFYYLKALPTQFQIAIWLHDVVEDTNTTIEEIDDEFMEGVADYVNAVTGVGKNRKARNESVYKKLNAFGSALGLKLADRIANTENCIKNNPDLLKMYRKEYPSFKSALSPIKNDNGTKAMWDHLDSLLLVKNV